MIPCSQGGEEMLTIKEFAKLCSCNTQTLRYYDRIDLLKPAKTDQWTGYRYYRKNQALDFVKIKNLQSAGFTIDEIKELLMQTDEQIIQAFDEKIRMQTEKLDHIRKIQQSYLKEKKMMERVIESMSAYLIQQMNDDEMMMEFGFRSEDKEKLKELMNTYFTHHLRRGLEKGDGEISLQIDDEYITGADEIVMTIDSLDSSSVKSNMTIGRTNQINEEQFELSEYDLVWEKHDWIQICNFLNEIPEFKEGMEYYIDVELEEEKKNVDLTFAMCLIASMILKNDGRMIDMSCNVGNSHDEKNHLKIYGKKTK